MLAYIIRRLLLIVPTLIGIMVINFAVIQFAPGGPIEQIVAQLTGNDVGATARIGGGGGTEAGATAAASQQASSGSAGDRPIHERFLMMMGNYLQFDFGTSYFRDEKVIDLVLAKLPVSISLGLWTTLLVYLISIPLGIRKAVNDGSPFDMWTSGVIIIGNAIPGFLFAVMLVVLFAGGSYLDWFPLRGLVSENWGQLSWPMQILDYLWHMVLPITALVIGGFAALTFLTKNSFLDQINQQYVLTAKAKGLTEHRVLYGHVFRNAMLIVIAGFPGAFVGILFTGALLIEIIFSLDGLGLLGFEAVIKRDYPIMFASLFFFASRTCDEINRRFDLYAYRSTD